MINAGTIRPTTQTPASTTIPIGAVTRRANVLPQAPARKQQMVMGLFFKIHPVIIPASPMNKMMMAVMGNTTIIEASTGAWSKETFQPKPAIVPQMRPSEPAITPKQPHT